MEHDSKDETANPSIPPSNCKINTLRINMHIVETYQIKNSTIRQWFCNIPFIIDIAKKRQLDWIGKVTLTEETKIQRQLLISWTSITQGKSDTLQISPRNTFALQAIHEMPNTPLSATSRKASQKHGRHKQKTKRFPQYFPARGGNRTQDPNRKQPWN